MGKLIRATVIGLLNRDVTFNDIQGFINDKLSEKALTGFKTVQGISTTETGEKQRHIKFSRLFPIDKLDHRWNLSLSHEFHNAGYGDVAWKFTEVDSEDPEAEDTTVSIHPDLFKACLDEDECPRHPTAPPEPFGSDAFWRWFDEQD
jgi:hypothetical protein